MQRDGGEDCLFELGELDNVVGEIWTENEVGVPMRATHQIANTLQECQPGVRITQGPKDLRGRSPLAHIVSAQVDEVEAPGALDKARSLKKMRRARNGSQAGQPGNLRQA